MRISMRRLRCYAIIPWRLDASGLRAHHGIATHGMLIFPTEVRVLISADRPDLSPPHTSFLIAHAVPQCQPFPNALLPRMMALRSPQRALVFLLELVSCVSVYIRAHIPLSPSCVVSTRPYLPAMISTIIWSNHEKHHRSPR